MNQAITESDFTPMTFTRRTNTRRRRTRLTSSPDQQMSILPTPEPQDNNIPNPHTKSPQTTKEADNPQLVNPSLTNSIDQIRSEIHEELRSTLVESDYWDESHNWGADHEVESDDYWHFVGRFE